MLVTPRNKDDGSLMTSYVVLKNDKIEDLKMIWVKCVKELLIESCVGCKDNQGHLHHVEGSQRHRSHDRLGSKLAGKTWRRVSVNGL